MSDGFLLRSHNNGFEESVKAEQLVPVSAYCDDSVLGNANRVEFIGNEPGIVVPDGPEKSFPFKSITPTLSFRLVTKVVPRLAMLTSL